LQEKCELTLEDHSEVMCCSVLFDGRIVSGSRDFTLKIWNINTGECELTLKGHMDSIVACSVLPNGKIISGSVDKTIKIWNIQTGVIEQNYSNSIKCELTLTGHFDAIMCVSISSDFAQCRIVSGLVDGTLKVWNVQTDHLIDSNKRCELTLKDCSEECLMCCCILSDGRIISGSDEGILKIWNIQNGVLEQSFSDKNKRKFGNDDNVKGNMLMDTKMVDGYIGMKI